MRARLLSLLKLYEDEVSLLLWTAALLFIIRSSGIILNNYAETAFLKRYGVEYLPIVNMLNAVATFLVTGFLTTFMAKMPGAKILSWMFIISGVLVTLIRLAIPLGYDLLYPALFMLKSQFELLQAMLFWNMCNDIFNTRQSKRLFPLLTAGGVIGLILGSFGTPYFAGAFSMDNLLYLYLCTTFAGAVIVQAMGRSYPTLIFSEKKSKKGSKRPSMIQEFKNVMPMIKDSVLIKIVLVLTFMPNVIIPIMNYQFNYAVNDQFASETAMIHFFGYFRGGLYMISLFILLFVGRIYGRWGLPVALMFHPFNYMIALFGFLFRFDIFSAMYARMSTNIIRTTINMPANSILIGLFPESYRNMIRPFLRGTVVRIALFTGSSLILASEGFMHPRYLTLVALPFMLAWISAPIILKSKYALILKDLISRNLLDIKSFKKEELGQIFKGEKVLEELEQAFMSARGRDAVWYAKLLKNFSSETLDTNIFKTLHHQDDETKIALIKMVSDKALKTDSLKLLSVLDPEKPELCIAVLKIICRDHSIDITQHIDITPYLEHTHPVVRGFAAACLYARNPEQCTLKIKKWIKSSDPEKRQSGVIAAGLSSNTDFIDPLLNMLEHKDIEPIIPDIIIALSRLGTDDLNAILFPYLSCDREDIRMAALDALQINDDISLKKAIQLLADPSDDIREFAGTKILEAEYQNNRVLIESLGLPSSRIRKKLFELLETLDIKEFDILMFARKTLNRSYAWLAMAENLNTLPKGRFRDLVIEHLIQKKELALENLLRVLALQDRTGQVKAAWQSIYSVDTRQRANAIELLSDVMDKKLFKAIIPLLESPTPAVALADGKKFVKIPDFTPDGSDVFLTLVSSKDWVDIMMALCLAQDNPGLLEGYDLISALENFPDKNILKEAQMILKKIRQNKADKTDNQPDTTSISLGEKILLLKEIEIFSGLSASELAAIATVTKEHTCPENEIVIKQNDPGETVFLIIEGRVDVIMEQADNTSVKIDQISAGGAFGEMALIDDSPRSATIKTAEPCRFLILHKQEFKETVMEYPGIALQVCSVLSRRIRHLHNKVKEACK